VRIREATLDDSGDRFGEYVTGDVFSVGRSRVDGAGQIDVLESDRYTGATRLAWFFSARGPGWYFGVARPGDDAADVALNNARGFNRRGDAELDGQVLGLDDAANIVRESIEAFRKRGFDGDEEEV